MTVGFQRSVTVLLLLTIPATAFAQVKADERQLDRVRARLSEAPGLTGWDRHREAAELPWQASSSCEDAKRRGRLDAADQHGGNGWWSSAAVGFVLPIIGIGLATGTAALSRPQPKTVVADLDQRCYREGYAARARNKNIRIAAGSSALGTVLVAVLLAASGGFYVMPSGPS